MEYQFSAATIFHVTHTGLTGQMQKCAPFTHNHGETFVMYFNDLHVLWAANATRCLKLLTDT